MFPSSTRREWLQLVGLSSLALAAQPRAFAQGFEPDVELTLTAAPADVALLPGGTTQVLRYTGTLQRGPEGTLQALPGSYLGPTLHLRTGQRVRIRFINKTGEPSIVHWHGLDVPERADGHPRLAVGDGSEYVYEFTVTNRAGLYWYHPHPHMRTAVQAYRGLAGLIVVSDDTEDGLKLPSGESEIFAVLQDRRFDDRNQLVYAGNMMAAMNGYLGDRLILNGMADGVRDVDTGWVRVRLLNGSNARIYKLGWSRDLPMVVIGGDGGLLERPLSMRTLTLAPGQRADVLVDLSALPAETEVALDSRAFTAADAGRMGGMMGGVSSAPNGTPMRVLTLRTRRHLATPFQLPTRLSAFDASWAVNADAPVRRVILAFAQMQWSIGGRTFDMTDVAPEETVAAGSTHIWEFTNLPTGMVQAAHPMHLHGRQFRVVGRSGADANTLRDGIVDAGWTDTTLVLPGETVRIQVPFSRYTGTFMYHCHILEHEDMGMMRNLRIV